MPKVRGNTRPPSELAQLCDVPWCKRPGKSFSLGHLCVRHAGRFQEDVKRDVVFITELFLDAETADDDQRAREECYSQWLGRVAQATARPRYSDEQSRVLPAPS